MNSAEVVPAMFLDGSKPTFEASRSTRVDWVNWMVSPQNKQFAQAMTNRVWGQLLGVGIVDPVDDFQEGNPSSHPELLNALAADFAAAEFKPSFLYRTICQSEVYGRTSRRTQASQDLEQSFSRAAIKPMSGEQLFDSLAQAIGYQTKTAQLGAGRDEDQVRRRILDLFQSNGEYSNPQTSVTHALTLMNGRLTNDAASATASETLKRLLNDPQATSASQVDALYLLTVSRWPAADERESLVAYVETGDATERPRRLGDIFWALLNSAEFRWNH